MVLTWRRYVPKHYGTAAEPLPSRLDEASMQPFPFMRLPVELRLQVYKEYLSERYRLLPEEIHEMVLDPRHRNKRPAEILQVNKAINTEVKNLLQHETTFCLRICWQDATFDGYVRSCIQARGKRLDYEHVGHLRIEIYPPHEDRPVDMVYIWTYVQRLCEDLQKASCLRHLSIRFMENEYAGWTRWIDGLPSNTMRVYGSSDIWRSDILHVLDLFKLLNNVTKAEIHLPHSLNDDRSLQQVRQDVEEVMMRVKSLDDGHRQWVITLERVIAENEVDLMCLTGSLSQLKLDRSCGLGYWISETDLNIFESVWPLRYDGTAHNYRPRSDYVGDESLENASLSHVNHYRSDSYNIDLARLFDYMKGFDCGQLCLDWHPMARKA